MIFVSTSSLTSLSTCSTQGIASSGVRRLVAVSMTRGKAGLKAMKGVIRGMSDWFGEAVKVNISSK